MKINFELLLLLCDLYKTVSVKTPRRLEVILEILKDIVYTEDSFTCKREVIIDLHDEETPFQNSSFKFTIQTLARLEQNLPKLKFIIQKRLNYNRYHLYFIKIYI